MKRLFILFIILLQMQVYANMANPVKQGTFGGRPFVSKYVDVIHENLFIKIDKDFEFASFNVTYYIHSSIDGFQIPFLFIASDYLDSFTITIDGKKVSIQDIPDEFEVPENTKFKDFSYFFEPPSYDDYSHVTVDLSSKGGRVFDLNQMIYFETDITKGRHVIEVNYKATKWTHKLKKGNEFSFRYALSPAKYWKSFGTLNIKVDASECAKELTSNLGQPKNGNLRLLAEWDFDHLPVEMLQINYMPYSNTILPDINKSFIIYLFIIGGILALWFFKAAYLKIITAKGMYKR
jgi:hypothetical protein